MFTRTVLPSHLKSRASRLVPLNLRVPSPNYFWLCTVHLLSQVERARPVKHSRSDYPLIYFPLLSPFLLAGPFIWSSAVGLFSRSTMTSSTEPLETTTTAAVMAHNFTEHFAFLVSTEDFGLVLLQLQLVLTAIFTVYIGAHASLERPTSAAPLEVASACPDSADPKQEEPKDLPAHRTGFMATDAILMPLISGVLLVGMYYLIKWLDQYAWILDQVVQGLFSSVAIIGTGKLLADTLNFLGSLLFPSIWMDSKGSVFRVDPVQQIQVRMEAVGSTICRIPDEQKKTPLPDILGSTTGRE